MSEKFRVVSQPRGVVLRFHSRRAPEGLVRVKNRRYRGAVIDSDPFGADFAPG